MEPYQLPNDEEVKWAYQQGEEAVVGLFRKLTENLKVLAARKQAVEVLRLAVAGTLYLLSFVSTA